MDSGRKEDKEHHHDIINQNEVKKIAMIQGSQTFKNFFSKR